jgi:hypothetical protein
MRFTIGIYTKAKLDGTFMVCASTWFSKKPDYSLANASVAEMRKSLIALVCTEGKKESTAINSAVARTIEQLFVRGLIANPLNDYPPILIHAAATAKVVNELLQESTGGTL